jgi:hypothetical protein
MPHSSAAARIRIESPLSKPIQFLSRSGLGRYQPKSLVSAFRQRFRLAQGASLSAAITQKQHHDWVEAYLVQAEART